MNIFLLFTPSRLRFFLYLLNLQVFQISKSYTYVIEIKIETTTLIIDVFFNDNKFILKVNKPAESFVNNLDLFKHL